ncbi:MAG: hypothetical protein K0S34_1667 [Bacillales bacterium]|jgi:hypothetical protein|nr:hypothetical protein [Bacillales bacterium]
MDLQNIKKDNKNKFGNIAFTIFYLSFPAIMIYKILFNDSINVIEIKYYYNSKEDNYYYRIYTEKNSFSVSEDNLKIDIYKSGSNESRLNKISKIGKKEEEWKVQLTKKKADELQKNKYVKLFKEK